MAPQGVSDATSLEHDATSLGGDTIPKGDDALETLEGHDVSPPIKQFRMEATPTTFQTPAMRLPIRSSNLTTIMRPQPTRMPGAMVDSLSSPAPRSLGLDNLYTTSMPSSAFMSGSYPTADSEYILGNPSGSVLKGKPRFVPLPPSRRASIDTWSNVKADADYQDEAPTLECDDKVDKIRKIVAALEARNYKEEDVLGGILKVTELQQRRDVFPTWFIEFETELNKHLVTRQCFKSEYVEHLVWIIDSAPCTLNNLLDAAGSTRRFTFGCTTRVS